MAKDQYEELKDPIVSLFRIVGLLVSLMISLAFSDVIDRVREIQNAIEGESSSINDVFNDLKFFDAENAKEIRSLVIEYVRALIEDDWPALADDKLGRRADALRRQLSDALINLEHTTPKQGKVWSLIVADLDALSDYRVIRLDNALAKPPVFVYVNIFGFIVTMACFGVYRPRPSLVVLVSFYTVFVGLVLYLILKLSDPFQGDIAVAPTTYEFLLERLQAEMR